jgi:hypothetical protein
MNLFVGEMRPKNAWRWTGKVAEKRALFENLSSNRWIGERGIGRV